MRYAFANCILDTQLYSLYRDGRHVRLRPKVFQILCYLLQHRDRVVPKQELCEQVWAMAVVSDATLENSLAAVRRAVGDSGRAQTIIQTHYSHGYRFVATVTPHSQPDTDESSTSQEAAASLDSLPLSADEPTTTDAPSVVLPAPSEVARRAHGLSPPGQTPVPMMPALEEYKIATLLCCALAGDDAETALPDHETTRQQAQTLYDRLRQVGSRYGGTVVPASDIGAMLVFGAPVAQEDHAQRAVFAAADLCVPADTPDQSYSQRLALRLSIHTGSIVVEGGREVQSPTSIYLGTTEAVAMALLKQSLGGRILCSETTAALVRRWVRLQKLEPVLVEGQAMLIQAYEVMTHDLQRVPLPIAFVGTNRPLVGRDQELIALYTRWTRVEEGQGQVVGIVGEPGIGKSRLLYEFRRGLGERPHTYLRGRCRSFGRHSPYLPLLEVLRQRADIMDTEQAAAVVTKVRRYLSSLGMAAEEDAPYLLYLLRGQEAPAWLHRLSPETRKVRTIEIFLHLIWQTAQRHPLVIEIENLHWIDATSEALLSALVERLAGLPILLLVTYRPGYSAPWMAKSYVTQISLTGLKADHGQRVVEAVLGSRHLPETLLHEIVAKANGNPFFLEELARTVGQYEPPHATLVVPDSIQTVLASRIDQLPPAAKRLLQIAAVIGAHVPVALLGASTAYSEETLQSHLRDLQAAEFLTETALPPQAAYTFKHDLIRATAYQSLLPHTRQHYHRRIAQALLRQFPEVVEHQPERLAHHCMQGGWPQDAITHWQRAGQQAQQNGANVEAAEHFANALEALRLLPDTPERDRQELTLQTGYGTAMAATKGLAAPEVADAFTRARTLCQQVGETPQLFPVLWGLRMFYMARGDLPAAHDVAQTFFSRARQQRDTGPRLVSHQALGVALYYLGDLSAAQVHLEQMRALYESRQHTDHAAHWVTNAVAIGLCYGALTLWHLGYPNRSEQRSREALRLIQETPDPFGLAPVLFLTAALHLLRRDVEGVQQHAEMLITLATEKSFQYRLAQGLMMHGWSVAIQGRIEEGIAQIRQGLAAYEATGAQQGRYLHLMCLADVYSRNQQFDMARQVLDEALTAACRTGQQLGEARLCRRQGDLLLAQATWQQQTRRAVAKTAEQHLRRALDMAHNLQARSLELRAAMSLGRLWKGQGKQAKARHLLTTVYEGFTEGFETPELQEARTLLKSLAVNRAKAI